ncbi:Reticulocyte-binding protein 2-like a [Symbiodinium microadriaticum]|uniref:Reticulocyte-binding protein 2-like a n=1 Tax=Symbiodinium microadriaticum TaxID=2951 RepID=A0A1Q9D8W3_SYMMI|nr:Reticulocyte-binding protein 2-like a [Symbiodinium microadriaticum]
MAEVVLTIPEHEVDKGAEGPQLSELERKVIAKILKQCLSRVRRLLEKSESSHNEKIDRLKSKLLALPEHVEPEQLELDLTKGSSSSAGDTPEARKAAEEKYKEAHAKVFGLRKEKMAKSARAADEKTAKSSGADEKTAKSSGADDEKTAKPSKAKPRPSKKAEAKRGTFAGRNWPTGPLPSMRFDAAYEAWHLDDKFARHKQRAFLSFLTEHGLQEIHEEGDMYERCHEMAILFMTVEEKERALHASGRTKPAQVHGYDDDPRALLLVDNMAFAMVSILLHCPDLECAELETTFFDFLDFRRYLLQDNMARSRWCCKDSQATQVWDGVPAPSPTNTLPDTYDDDLNAELARLIDECGPDEEPGFSTDVSTTKGSDLERLKAEEEDIQHERKQQQAAAEVERKRQEAAEMERKRQEAAEMERKRQEAAEMERKRQEAAEMEKKRQEAAEMERRLQQAAGPMQLSPSGKRSLSPPMSPLSKQLKQAEEEEAALQTQMKKQKLEELQRRNELMRQKLAGLVTKVPPVAKAALPLPTETPAPPTPSSTSVPPSPSIVPPSPASVPATPMSMPAPASVPPTPASVPATPPTPKAPSDLQRSSPLQHQGSNVSSLSDKSDDPAATRCSGAEEPATSTPTPAPATVRASDLKESLPRFNRSETKKSMEKEVLGKVGSFARLQLQLTGVSEAAGVLDALRKAQIDLEMKYKALQAMAENVEESEWQTHIKDVAAAYLICASKEDFAVGVARVQSSKKRE